MPAHASPKRCLAFGHTSRNVWVRMLPSPGSKRSAGHTPPGSSSPACHLHPAPPPPVRASRTTEHGPGLRSHRPSWTCKGSLLAPNSSTWRSYGSVRVNGPCGRSSTLSGDPAARRSLTWRMKVTKATPPKYLDRWMKMYHAMFTITIALPNLGPLPELPDLTTHGRWRRSDSRSMGSGKPPCL